MPRSRSRKPKQKTAPPGQSPPRKVWLSAVPGRVWAGVLAFCTLLGVFVLWPRVTVDAAGDFSNPASIEFTFRNIGFIPLWKPVYGILGCEIIYGAENPALKNPMKACEISDIKKTPPPPPDKQQWLGMDDVYTLRLEDYFRIENLPITRANLVVEFAYYPWFIPWRLQKNFAFMTAEGSDKKLYWRAYPAP